MRSRSRISLALLLLFACAPERHRARIIGFDGLAPPGQPLLLAAKLEANDFLRLHPDLEGETLLYRHRAWNEEVGRAVTGRDGVARLQWTPPTPGCHTIDVSVESGRRRASGTLRVFARSPTRPVLVVDLDGTVCAGSALAVLRRPPERVPVVGGAPESLRRLTERYDIVYLTARDEALLARSRDWLDHHAFPIAPLLARDIGLSTLSAGRYKRTRLAELREVWHLVAGAGDRRADIEAYESASMLAFSIPEKGWAFVEEALQKLPPSADGPPDHASR